MLKKLLALTVSAALIIPAFALTSLASNGDIVDVGDGSHEKFLTDFENYDDGLRISQAANGAFSAGYDDDAQGGVYQIQAGKGQNGSKGLYEGASAQLGNGVFAGFTYIPQRDTPTKAVDFTGATDFVFWIDNTFQTNTDNNSAFQIVFEEYDYNPDGTLAMVTNTQDQEVPKVTSRNLPDSADTVWYTMADDENTWTQQAGTQSYYLRVPTGFKGYVRIPLSSFELCWSSTDNNNKVDLQHIVDLNMYYGIYPRDINGAFILDNLGFLGNFQEPATTTEPTTVTTTEPTTTTTEPTTVTTEPTVVTTTEPTTVTTEDTATNTTTEPTATTTEPSGVTTTAPPTTVTTTQPVAVTTTASVNNSEDTTTTPETTATQSPKTGEAPIAAALLTAVALAGVLVVTKKSK